MRGKSYNVLVLNYYENVETTICYRLQIAVVHECSGEQQSAYKHALLGVVAYGYSKAFTREKIISFTN